MVRKGLSKGETVSISPKYDFNSYIQNIDGALVIEEASVTESFQFASWFPTFSLDGSKVKFSTIGSPYTYLTNFNGQLIFKEVSKSDLWDDEESCWNVWLTSENLNPVEVGFGEIYSFAAYDSQNNYFCSYAEKIEKHPHFMNPIEESCKFQVVPRLDGFYSGVSLMSAKYPNHYLREKDGRIVLEQTDGSAIYNEDSSFFVVEGLVESEYSISFESSKNSGKFFVYKDNQIFLEDYKEEREYEVRASWLPFQWDDLDVFFPDALPSDMIIKYDKSLMVS